MNPGSSKLVRAAKRYRCPTCKAAALEACVTLTGHVMTGVHSSRAAKGRGAMIFNGKVRI